MPRRETGIRRKGAGWQARIYRAGVVRSATFATHDAAKRWRAEQVASAEPVDGSNVTLDDLVASDPGHLRPTTQARNDSAYKVHIGHRWGSVPLAAITRADTQVWVKELAERGLAPSTIHRVTEVASRLAQAAVDQELVERNPFRRLGLPRIEQVERRFVTVEEARLIEAEVGPWWSLLIPFTLDTGLRISELAGLQAGDVIWRDGGCIIRIQRIVTDTGGVLRIGPPKTRAGIRVIPTVTRPVSARLNDHIASRQLAPTDSLFGGERGGTMRPTNWRARVFSPAVRAAGLAGITPHSLRHGAVARWIAAGQADPYVLSRWLGHSSPVIVYRTYAHLLPQDATSITARMEAEAAAAADMEDWESPL